MTKDILSRFESEGITWLSEWLEAITIYEFCLVEIIISIEKDLGIRFKKREIEYIIGRLLE